MSNCKFNFIIKFLFCLWLCPAAFAHKLQVEPVVVELRPQKTFIVAMMSGNGEDVIQAVDVRDDERDGNEGLKESVTPRLEAYINEHLVLRQGGQILQGRLEKLEYWRPDSLDYTKSKFEALIRYQRDPSLADKPFQVTSRLFDYLPNAEVILSVSGLQKRIAAGATVDYDPSAVAANLARNIRDFAWMGMEHIFLGPDHMLFILALLVTAPTLGVLVKTLTGFTIAHSITLVLSALSVIVLPNHVVDIIIALSIIYVGLENIFRKDANRNRFLVAGLFGLIHGFGFSYILREIGLPEEGLVWCLLSFNIGVEIAQIIVCAIAFPLLVRFRKHMEHRAQYGGMSWPRVVTAMSWAVVAAGSYWMLQRIIEA
jgi:hydrogenase/urease accessory protein HupE